MLLLLMMMMMMMMMELGKNQTCSVLSCHFFLQLFLCVSTREQNIALSQNYPSTPSIAQEFHAACVNCFLTLRAIGWVHFF
jgi:hypothetical protein